jgi:hypothetical protein
MKVLLSLFDYTGQWSKPFKDDGWCVIQNDLKSGQDIFSDTVPAAIEDHLEGNFVDGILAAIPCTDFAGSGARWWADKDKSKAPYHKDIVAENKTDFSAFMVHTTLLIKDLVLKSGGFWCIENPVGRIHSLVPEIGKPKMYFNPCDFGDPYTKKTALYGEFNTSLKKNPVFPTEGSKMHRLYGGKSERTKAMRSITPKGFARAFFDANNNYQPQQLKLAI